jgi:hypothetical protein
MSSYGPFVHGLNKGGLVDIVRSSSLRGVGASNNMTNDRLAVRAYTGGFEFQRKTKRWSGADKTFIEFMTDTPPRPNLPPGYAEWTEEGLNDGVLKIRILRIVDGDGNTVSTAKFGAR